MHSLKLHVLIAAMLLLGAPVFAADEEYYVAEPVEVNSAHELGVPPPPQVASPDWAGTETAFQAAFTAL